MSHFSSDGPEAPFPDSHKKVPTFPSHGGRDRRDASGAGSLLILAAITVGILVVVIAAVVRWAS